MLHTLDAFTSTDLALFIWSASKLRMSIPHTLEAALLQKVIDLAPDFNAIDVSNTLVGLAWFAHPGPTRLRSIRRGNSKPDDEHSGAYGCESWDVGSTLFQGAVGALEKMLSEGCAGGLNGQGTANVAWALARIRGLRHGKEAGASTPAAHNELPGAGVDVADRAKATREGALEGRLGSGRAAVALLLRARETVAEMTPPGLVMMFGAVPPLVSWALHRRVSAGGLSDGAADAGVVQIAELEEQVLHAVRDRSLDTVRRFDPHAIAHFLWLIAQRRKSPSAFASDKGPDSGKGSHRDDSEPHSEEEWRHWEEDGVEEGYLDDTMPREAAFCDDEMKYVLMDHAAQVSVDVMLQHRHVFEDCRRAHDDDEVETDGLRVPSAVHRPTQERGGPRRCNAAVRHRPP